MLPSLFINDMFFKDLELNRCHRDDMIEKNKNESILYLDLPGVKKENIKLTVENRYLVVEFERSDHIKNKGKKTYVLPDRTDIDKIECSLEHGVLKIQLPLSTSARPKEIQIR